MITGLRRIGFCALGLALIYASVLGLYTFFSPHTARPGALKEDLQWMSTSRSSVDRFSCRWMGVCGGGNWKSQTWLFRSFGSHQTPIRGFPWRKAWHDSHRDPSKWSKQERISREIPDYVYDYAPLVHLHSEEQFWPTDLAEFLSHVQAKLNHTLAEKACATLTNVSQLNAYQGGHRVFLTSNDDPEQLPDWLTSRHNIPQPYDQTEMPLDTHPVLADASRPDKADFKAESEGWYDAGRQNPKLLVERGSSSSSGSGGGGHSAAPAFLIAVDKGNGVVDAFWFYFYAFNQGQRVMNIRFGNHVGDWEHSMVRFHHGVPKAIFLSAHEWGAAYSYDAMEKRGKRPVIYSALGSHAMYATPGTYPYILPFGMLHDSTSRGPLWDPARNAHAFVYDGRADKLRASMRTPLAPTGWFGFAGHWGDRLYPLDDRRQYRFAGQYHYVNGPRGPRFKNLGRSSVCQSTSTNPRGMHGCQIKNWRKGTHRAKRWLADPEADQ